MKIASFTQTYGDKRVLELMLLKYDIIGNKFRNNCDKIVFSFHNCPTEFFTIAIQILKDIYPSDKLLFLRHNNVSYLESIKQTLKILKKSNIDYILQIQDDQHGINNKNNIENLDNVNVVFDFIREKRTQFLHIFENEGNPKYNSLVPLEIIKKDNVEFYKYNSRYFQTQKIYSWNDGTYFADINFLIRLFDIDNLPTDVWQLELALKYIFDNNDLERWGINILFFKASNLHGRNINSSISPEENLARFFAELDDWPNIVNLIKTYLV
jgi:hypothetical protein